MSQMQDAEVVNWGCQSLHLGAETKDALTAIALSNITQNSVTSALAPSLLIFDN